MLGGVSILDCLTEAKLALRDWSTRGYDKKEERKIILMHFLTNLDYFLKELNMKIINNLLTQEDPVRGHHIFDQAVIWWQDS